MAKKKKAERKAEEAREARGNKGVNKEVWAQAEANVGGLAGLDEKARNDLIRRHYDKMIASDQGVKDWAGNDPRILGDIGQKEGK